MFAGKRMGRAMLRVVFHAAAKVARKRLLFLAC